MSQGEPHAAWFPNRDANRMLASFIPAPARAEAPSNVAAPPAMADRVIRPADLTGTEAIRTHPVRIEVEYSAGRIETILNPEELTIRAGDGVEWDFRYTGGADLMVDEVVIELPKPSPFAKTSYRLKKPTSPRLRQLSGPSVLTKTQMRVEYSIRILNSFKIEVASAKPRLVVEP